MFNYGVFVEYLIKIPIQFRFKSNNGGTWEFLFRKKCFSKKCSFGHVGYSFGNLVEKISHQFFDILPVKLRKQRLIEIHCFSRKINMRFLIKSIWTRRIQLWKPCRNIYSAFWNFVCQNPKRNVGNIYYFKKKTSAMTFHSTSIIQRR